MGRGPGSAALGRNTCPAEGWIANVPEVLDVPPQHAEFAIHSVVPRATGFQVAFTLGSAAAARLTVHDVTGRRLADQDISGAGKQRVELTTAALAPGIYWVRLEQAGEKRVAKTIFLR